MPPIFTHTMAGGYRECHARRTLPGTRRVDIAAAGSWPTPTSARRGGPFVPVNCAGLAESILGSQLFGHRKGAFTGAIADQEGLFEAAQGGTLFLDEVGDVAMAIQSALLRVLQEIAPEKTIPARGARRKDPPRSGFCLAVFWGIRLPA